MPLISSMVAASVTTRTIMAEFPLVPELSSIVLLLALTVLNLWKLGKLCGVPLGFAVSNSEARAMPATLKVCLRASQRTCLPTSKKPLDLLGLCMGSRVH